METSTELVKKARKDQLAIIKVKVFADLVFIGEKLGFETKKEWKTKTGLIDYVWYLEFPFNFPERKDKKIPVVGFEVETGFRTRKHLKGNILNLLELSPTIGVIILLEDGFKGRNDQFRGSVKAVKIYAKRFRALSDIFVWSEKELKAFMSIVNNYERPEKFESDLANKLRAAIKELKQREA